MLAQADLGYLSSVEASGPVFGSTFAGSVAFTSLKTHSILGLPATDGCLVYTNAPTRALTDPSNFTAVVDGSSYSFAGFDLASPRPVAAEEDCRGAGDQSGLCRY